jgi:transposase
MDKYIGFDIDDKKTVACIVQKNKNDIYQTLPTDPAVMKQWLKKQRKGKQKLHLTFEISGMAGWLYDELVDTVDTLAVSNPSKMTWIYRTAKKTDRIDARKQAVLLQLGELPRVHMPSKAVRQWRGKIQHRRKLISLSTQTKNRIRTLVKNHGYRRAHYKGGWWNKDNRSWMMSLAEEITDSWADSLYDLLEQLSLYEGQIKRVTQQLDERLKYHPGSALLLTIPGVGLYG